MRFDATVRSLAVAAAILACRCEQPPEPQRTVIRYVRAVRSGDCATAWTMLSRHNRAAIDLVWEHRRPSDDLRRKDDLHCYENRFDGWQLDTLRVLAAKPSRMSVAVERGERSGFRVPGFLPSRTAYRTETFDVVQEGGAWKIEHPPMARYLEIRERQRALARTKAPGAR